MTRFIYFLVITFLFLSACSRNEKQIDNEKYILGDWIKIKSQRTILEHEKEKIVLMHPDFYEQGYTFYKENKYEKKGGFFKDTRIDTAGIYNNGLSPADYLGTQSKYIITSDSLKIFEPGESSWENYKIATLNADTLKIIHDDIISTFARFKIKPNKTPSFDTIVLSTSGCFGRCPILNIMVSSDGSVIFQGQRNTKKMGLFKGKIKKDDYLKIQNGFRKTDFNLLKNKYLINIDASTTTTTFVKDGKIYKSVSGGENAPAEFTWAFPALKYLYHLIPLTNMNFPDYMSEIHSNLNFEKSDQILILKKSERFLLMNYLSEGKISNIKFDSRFKIEAMRDTVSERTYNILTDGRYYQLMIKGKPITIDIGFNFYDVNIKHWKWEKIKN